MKNDNLNHSRVMRSAAWMWTLYLVCLFVVDAIIYARRLDLAVLTYHLINAVPALIFLGLSYTQKIIKPTRITTAVMILLISGASILVPHLLDLKLPPAPLSNLEGMVLRQLPVLMIGLILIAWHYNIQLTVLYSAVLNCAELLLVFALNRLDGERLLAFVFIVLIRLVCFIVVGIFIRQLITLLRNQQIALASANQRLTHYATTLETLTVSRERNRMSRELHDTVVHTLSGLAVQLETISAYLDVNPETAQHLLNQALATTRSGLQETRRALKALRASPLDDLGLIIAIRELAMTAAERCKADLTLSLPDQNLILPSEVEQCLYRATQEAVENVVHHANAQHLSVSFSVHELVIELVIQDDGMGFNPSDEYRPGHFGIPGMRERAELAGGELSIMSKPNQGTIVRLVIKGVIQ